MLITGPRRPFPPVADHDSAVTDFGTAVTVRPAANDIAYQVPLFPGSIDLDPATAGRQTTRTVAGGQFTLDPDGSLAFSPAAGFSGKATASYTVRDQAYRLSNVANVVVTVQPDPGAAIRLAPWETGTEGWAPGNWQANAGTLAQTADFHTDGSFGLHLDAVEGGWFGVTLPGPVDLSAKSTVRFDLRTGPAAGTSRSVVFQVGPEFTWCQSTFVWVPQDSTVTAEVDLLSEMSCDPARSPTSAASSCGSAPASSTWTTCARSSHGAGYSGTRR